MCRRFFSLILPWLLFAYSAIGASPSETSVSKPNLTCPHTKLGNEDLQAQYEKMWKQFTAEVDMATRGVDTDITTRFTEAHNAGHLDLALMWDGMKKAFTQSSELRWDSAKEKKTWNQRFGDVEFPDDLSELLQNCDRDYKSARERLKEGYSNIEIALTKAGKLEQAVEVRSECKAVLAAKFPPQPVAPGDPAGMPEAKRRSEPHTKSLLERLQGKWVRPNYEWSFEVRGKKYLQYHSSKPFAVVNEGELQFLPGKEYAIVQIRGGYTLWLFSAGDDVVAREQFQPDGTLGSGVGIFYRAGTHTP